MKQTVKTIVIDSDSETAAWLKEVVGKNYPETEILVAGNGVSVFGLIIKNNPEVVFLDISDEEKNGIKVCGEIRKSLLADKVSVVFLSAKNSNQNLRTDALEAGADAILRKPVDLTELRVLLKSLNKIRAVARGNEIGEVGDSFGEQQEENNKSTKANSANEKISILKLSEEKFRKLFENHSAVKLLIDPESGRIIDANRSAVDFYGWSRDELKHMNINQLNTLDKEDIEKLMAYAREHQRNYFEFKHRISTGAIRDVAVYTSGIEVNGKPILHSIIHDISEQHRIYEALEASEKRLKRAELVSKLGNWELHLKTKTIVGSDGALEIYGLKEKSIDYNIIKEIPLPEYRQMLDVALIQLITKEKPYNIDFKIKTISTGEIKDIHSEAVYDSERQIVFGIIQDVTAWKQAESRLKESEEKYRLMFETALEAIVVVANFRLIYFNPVVMQVTGFNETELMNMHFNDLVHPDDIDIVGENYLKRLEENQPKQSYEFRIIRKDGGIRWVTITGAKISWLGQPATYNFITDVTDRKKAENTLKTSEAKYRLITENSSDVIWIFNIDKMKFTYVSPSVYHLRGFTVEESMHETLDDSLTPESKKKVELILKNSLPGFLQNRNTLLSRSVHQIQQPCKNAKIIWVEVAIQFQFNYAGEIEVLGVSRNIDERKRMEDELRELIATKDKFFSIIAHDLKSPFNNIAGFSEFLSNEAKTLDITEIIQYSGLINTSAKNTLVLLENLLEWAQLQRGQLLFNPVPVIVATSISEVLELISHAAKQKRIIIESSVPDDLILKVDENMFKFIIRNLAGNAVKFTHVGGKVKISIENAGDKVLITVKDNGIGISSKNIEKLFNITTGYVARGTANEKGTGLGLILCKEFVEKHNGRISVESQLGKGSNFIVELPQKK